MEEFAPAVINPPSDDSEVRTRTRNLWSQASSRMKQRRNSMRLKKLSLHLKNKSELDDRVTYDLTSAKEVRFTFRVVN